MSSQTMSLDRGEPWSSTSKAPSSSRDRTRTSRSSTMVLSHPSSAVMRDQTSETSLSVLVWHPTPFQQSSSISALSKTPILRDVPHVKRKFGRKERDSIGASSFDPSSMAGGSVQLATPESKSFVNLKSATPSWLREKPSKAKLGSANTSAFQRAGVWKRSTLTFRENGVLLIFGEDRAMLHSISASELSVGDIRLVDDSLFSRPYVLGIFARPSTLTAGVRSPHAFQAKGNSSNSSATSLQNAHSKSKEEPIHICFPTARKMYSWRSLLRTFARPEIYGPANGSKPTGTHRSYRQIDMTIHEIRLFAERPTSNADRGRRASGVASPPPPPDADDSVTAVARASSVVSPSSMHSEGVAIVTNNGNRRTSLEASARALGSVMDRIMTRDAGGGSSTNSHTVDAKTSNDDMLDDTKSSISADDLVSVSGPVVGGTSARQYDLPNSLPSGLTSVEMDRRGSDGSSHNMHVQSIQQSACFCQVWMNGEVIARTKVCSGTSSIAWFDKLSLQDLPQLGSIHIEVLQAWRPTKFVVLGHCDLPVETMRRGETIEGWFPIWSLPRLEDALSRRDERSASYAREMVGELKVALNVYDETILPSYKYADVSALLNGDKCADLTRRLCKELEEDRVVSHLVDVFTTGGTIFERLADLTREESSSFSTEPALLFRGNTLLSRAIDKFQRKYCLDWLEACIGPTVRRVSAERIKVEPGEASPVMSPTGLSGGVSASSHPATHSSSTQDDSNVETLKQLSEDLWSTIYAHRHKCPPDLRRALAVIRKTVNAHYNSAHGPGVQGVGAFVFLRLICPAITSPNLYGLMGSPPDPSSSARTLMLLAKVFLALANKRNSFDKDKEPWLAKLNDFLQRHAEAYDDFITTVSSEPDDLSRVESLGDEKDVAFQKQVRQRLEGLPTLHRESIPRPGLKIDNAQALASLVSYVVRNASIDSYTDQGNDAGPETSTSLITGNKHSADVHSNYKNTGEESEIVNDFVDLCCDIEDIAGYHLDRAGYRPEPIETFSLDALGGVFRTTSIFTANSNKSAQAMTQSSSGSGFGRHTASPLKSLNRSSNVGEGTSAAQDSSKPHMPRSESAYSIRMRRATVSGEARHVESSEDTSSSGGGSGGNGGVVSSTTRPKMSSIGRESFLHAQLPDKFRLSNDGNGASAGTGNDDATIDETSQTLDDRSAPSGRIPPATQDISAASSYDGTRRGLTDGHRRRQSAQVESVYARETAAAVAAAANLTSNKDDHPERETTADSILTGRNRLDGSIHESRTRGTVSGVEEQRASPPLTPSWQQFRPSTMGEGEETKKKRGWWRRNK